MRLEKSAPCKVNLLLNILGKRPDGFHELETVMHPHPRSTHKLKLRATGDPKNCASNAAIRSCPLMPRTWFTAAAESFLKSAGINGRGSHPSRKNEFPWPPAWAAEVATPPPTLLALNELFNHPLAPGDAPGPESPPRLAQASPFFLQDRSGACNRTRRSRPRRWRAFPR